MESHNYIPDVNDETVRYITDKYSLNNYSLADELKHRSRIGQSKMSEIIHTSIVSGLKTAADAGMQRFTVSFRYWHETAKTPGVEYKQRYNPNFSGLDNIFYALETSGIKLDVVKTNGRVGPIHYVYFDLDPEQQSGANILN